MKVYRFHQQIRQALTPTPNLVIVLRHSKISINRLLRRCSAGLLASYILTLTAGIHFYNQFAPSSEWLGDLILLLFALLFVCLLYVQYRYSEKKTEKPLVLDSEIKLNSFYVSAHYRANSRITGIYLIVTAAVWLWAAATPFSNQLAKTGSLMFFALILYGFGLFIIRSLLREKCAIGQTIKKFGSL